MENPLDDELEDAAFDPIFDASTWRIAGLELTMNRGCYCFSDTAIVNALLATARCTTIMPRTPQAELYASPLSNIRAIQE